MTAPRCKELDEMMTNSYMRSEIGIRQVIQRLPRGWRWLRFTLLIQTDKLNSILTIASYSFLLQAANQSVDSNVYITISTGASIPRKPMMHIAYSPLFQPKFINVPPIFVLFQLPPTLTMMHLHIMLNACWMTLPFKIPTRIPLLLLNLIITALIYNSS